MQAADWVVWAVFLLEYVVMAAASPNRILYVKRNPLNLAVIVLSYPHLPTLFGLVRLARLARFLRVLRLVGVTARGIAALRAVLWRRGVVTVAAISILIILAGGAGLVLLEPHTVRGGLGDAIWWAIVTVATVGHGDIAPTTLWGGLVAVVLMLSGVGLISTLAASITAYFLGQEENPTLTELKERTVRLEGLLNAILVQRPPALGGGGQESRPATPQTEPPVEQEAKSVAATTGKV